MADDHDHDSVPVFGPGERKEVRAAILAALRPLPIEGEPEELIEAMRGSMADPCLDLALKAALARFCALPVKDQGVAVRTILWEMPRELREEIRGEGVTDVCKRRLMEIVAASDGQGTHRVSNLSVVEALVSSGAFDAETTPRVIQWARKQDHLRGKRGW